MVEGIWRTYAQERVIFGRPAAAAAAEEAARLGVERVVITSTASVERAGLLEPIAAALGSRYAGRFTAVTAHSPRPCIIAGAERARGLGADLLLAVGGGSVIDASKVMQLALWHGIADADGLGAARIDVGADPSLWRGETGRRPRVVAVPTTLSAAEFTHFAGATDPRRRVKEAFGHPLTVPQAVILDPAMTLATPMELLLSTGIKAVDHAAERLCSIGAHPASDATALHALTLLARALPAACAAPEALGPRLDLQFGMWLSIAGLASGVPVGASHGLGHVLGAHAGLPHGITSCVTLPQVMAWNQEVNGDRQALVAAALGRQDGDAAAAIDALITGLGLPRRLGALGIDAADLPVMAEKALHDGMLRSNPRPIRTAEEALTLLKTCW